MMKEIEFSKLHCAGNDFVLIDARKPQPIGRLSEFARRVCRRKVSVGGDGLLALSSSKEGKLSVDYFNQDGSPAWFCGNGLLSVSRWISVREKKENPICIEWEGRRHEVWVSDARVSGQLPPPEDVQLDIGLESGGTVDYVLIGVPHVVRFDRDIDRMDVNRLGKDIRFDPLFAPDGANVDFCQQMNRHRLKLRTYERGLESETLSCGSGAAAAAYLAYKKGMTEKSVEVSAAGGVLTVRIESHERIFLEGKPRIVYSGFIEEL